MRANKGLLLFVLIVTAAGIAAAAYGSVRPELQEVKNEQQELEQLAEDFVTVSSAGSEGEAAEVSPADVKTDSIQVDFSSLQAQNPDTVAWLYLDGTGINYPVVQAADNSFYLRRSFSGQDSIAGTLFLDCSNSSSFGDANSIIHGHNMFDGGTIMFSSLIRYTDADYWKQHQSISLSTPDGEKSYQIFAVCQFDITAADASASFYRQDFRSADVRAKYIRDLQAQSKIQTGLTVPEEQELLTLSTCDRRIYGDNGRIVIVGYRIP